MKNNNNPFLETSHLKRILGDKLFCFFKKVFDFCGAPDAGKFLNQNFEWVTGYAPSYKVYTALLTQSGGDDPQTFSNTDNGNLVIGVTYEIANYAAGDDFTNVGAPSNANGVKFVATGTTAASWSGATELNYNNGAPVVKVLENTIGNIYWLFISNGNYIAKLDVIFTTEGKQAVFSSSYSSNNGFMPYYTAIINNDVDGEIGIFMTNGASTANIGLSGFPIEIRVYN